LAIRHKSGKITYVLYNATVYSDEHGYPQGVFAAARDITDLKKAEAIAQESVRKLGDAERLAAIGATAGMVGHDIRNPLQSITSDVYLANCELAALPESEQKNNIKESLDEIGKAVNYVNKIIADLQDFARPLTPFLQETDLKELVEDLMRGNDIPENIEVSSDVEKMQRQSGLTLPCSSVFWITGNKRGSSHAEGGKLTILAKGTENGIAIVVQDNGMAFPKKQEASCLLHCSQQSQRGKASD